MRAAGRELGLALNSTYVLRRRFDPEGTLETIEESGATVLVVVPVMMQRILELPEETLAKYELPDLRVMVHPSAQSRVKPFWAIAGAIEVVARYR